MMPLHARVSTYLAASVAPLALALAACQPTPPKSPPPDRTEQILRLQLAQRAGPPPRSLADAEAKAMWRGYLTRVGQPPVGNGGASADNAGSGSGSSGGGGGGQ